MAKGLTDRQKLWLSAYLGPARLNATKAAEIAGYAIPKQSGAENLSKPIVQEALALWRSDIRKSGISDVEYRLSRLDDLEQGYFALIAARKEAYKDDPKAIGGATGLVVGQLKKVVHVRVSDDAEDGDGPQTWTEEQWEFVADTAVTKEIRSTHEQAAKELGQWKENVNLSGEVGVRRYIGVDPDAV